MSPKIAPLTRHVHFYRCYYFPAPANSALCLQHKKCVRNLRQVQRQKILHVENPLRALSQWDIVNGTITAPVPVNSRNLIADERLKAARVYAEIALG